MKKISIIVLAIVLVACLAFSFTACQKSVDPETQLVMATNAEFAPFEYKIGSKFAGIDVEIAKYIADELGMELVILDMEFDSTLTNLEKIATTDIVMAALTVNETRKKTVDFTTSYYNASQMVVVPEANTAFDNCKSVADVEAVLATLSKVGVQSGTTGQYYVEGSEDWGFDGFEGVTCNPYQNAGLAVNDMKAGRVDAVVVDEAPAKTLTKKIAGIKVIDIPLTEEEYAIAVKKGEAGAALKEKINAILASDKFKAKYAEISEKYFGDGASIEGIEVKTVAGK